MHTMRCTSPISMVSQQKPESRWGLQQRRSATPYGPLWLGKDFMFLNIISLTALTRKVMQSAPSICPSVSSLPFESSDLWPCHVYGSWPWLTWDWMSRSKAKTRSVQPRVRTILGCKEHLTTTKILTLMFIRWTFWRNPFHCILNGYWVNVQYNHYLFAHLTYVLLPHYLGKHWI